MQNSAARSCYRSAPAAFDPDVAVIVPAVIAADPDVLHARRCRHHLNFRWRRRRRIRLVEREGDRRGRSRAPDAGPRRSRNRCLRRFRRGRNVAQTEPVLGTRQPEQGASGSHRRQFTSTLPAESGSGSRVRGESDASSLERRRVLHVNVTEHPTAEWAAQQIVEAVGPDERLERLVRDRDKIFGAAFDRRVDNLGLAQLRIAPRSPWQNGFAERWVGTARREIVDHVIVLGEHHLRRILREYVAYYNADRPHMSLEGDAPMPRDVEPPSMGRVVALPRLGGLHHRYARLAACCSAELLRCKLWAVRCSSTTSGISEMSSGSCCA